MSKATPVLSIFPLQQASVRTIEFDVVIPNAVDIARTIKARSDGYNGHSSLRDAVLAALPEGLKRPEYAGRVERLYRDVKRVLHSPTRSVPQEHWALLG